MFSLAAAYAAKIEAQHDRATAAQSTRDPVNDFVVHSAAKERMRVAHERGFGWRSIFGFFELRLQFAGRSIEQV